MFGKKTPTKKNTYYIKKYQMKSKRTLTPEQKKKVKLAIESIEHCSGLDRDYWMIAKTRHAPSVVCRKVLSCILHSKLKMNLSEIGGLVDCDHSSIIHHIRSVDNWFEMPQVYEKEIDMLSQCMMEYTSSFGDDTYIDRNGNKWIKSHA
jgi:hypothetical protein